MGKVLMNSLQNCRPPIPRKPINPNNAASHTGNPMKNKNTVVPTATRKPLEGKAILYVVKANFLNPGTFLSQIRPL